MAKYPGSFIINEVGTRKELAGLYGVSERTKDMPTVMRKAVFNFCPNCGADMRGDKK